MFTTSKIATTTLIALTLSMGLSACSPAHNDNIPSPSAAASNSTSPTASDTASPTASEDATTGSAVTSPSETSDSSLSTDAGKTAESANERINDFMATIKSEALVLDADPDAMAASKEPGGFNKAFEKSIAFIDTDKFPHDKIVSIVGGFAAIYLADNNASIVSKDADSMIVSGDNAVIDGDAFTVTLNGKEMKGKAGTGGSLVMTYTDGEWKLTGLVGAPK